MDITIRLTGTSALLCHNISLADPDNEFAAEIATYTAKRKKTEEDRRAIEKLEWYGGLYLHDGRPVMPTSNVRKSFIDAGKITKQGTMVARALNFTGLSTPIIHNGPEDLEEMRAKPHHVNRAAVGVSGKRVMRVRPQFPVWGVEATAMLLEDVMDPDDLLRVAKRAGVATGLGDNRVNGFGRFQVEILTM